MDSKTTSRVDIGLHGDAVMRPSTAYIRHVQVKAPADMGPCLLLYGWKYGPLVGIWYRVDR